MSLFIFLAVNFGLISLTFSVVMAINFAINGFEGGMNWLADRLGDLSSSARNNTWLVFVVFVIIVLNMEALTAYSFKPLLSPLPSIGEIWNKADTETKGITDGRTIERLSMLFNNGKALPEPLPKTAEELKKSKEAKAKINAESETKNSLMRRIMTRIKEDSNSPIWGIIAILSWPIGLLLIGFILSDDVIGNLTAMLSSVHGKSATTAGEATAGINTSGQASTKKRCWNSRLSHILTIVAGIVSIETVGEVLGNIFGKMIVKGGDKV